MADEQLSELVKVSSFGDTTKLKHLSIELMKEVAGVGIVIETYQTLKRARIETFFRRVYLELESLTAAERETFDEYLQSQEGSQILVDYVDRATTGLSDWGRGALALLFADEMLNSHEKRFHRYAANALPGLSNGEIDLFLKLRDYIEESKPLASDRPIELYSIELQNDFFKPISETQLLEDLEEFQQRGLVARDVTPGRLGGGPPTVIIGWPERCRQLASLLDRARELDVEQVAQ